MFRSHVMVCGGTGCTSSGSDKIAKAFEDEILATGLENEVKVIRTGCFGLCARTCPAGAISGTVRQPHTIDTAKCVKCGACIEKCKFGAISKG